MLSVVSFPERRWRPQVYQWLRERLESPGLLCLDWDETCAAGDIGEALLQFLDKDGGALQRYSAALAQGRVEEAYVEACFVLEGFGVEEAQRQCRAAVEWAIESGAVAIRPEIQDLMASARNQGWKVWVVSASVTPVVQAFAAHYDQEPEFVIGMDLQVKAGRYCAQLAGPATYRQGKVDAILQQIGRLPDLAVGDTLTDLEMLKSAGDALLIGPRHPDLLPLAKQHGWAVQPIFEEVDPKRINAE